MAPLHRCTFLRRPAPWQADTRPSSAAGAGACVEGCVTGTARERLVLREHLFRKRRHRRSESGGMGRATRTRPCRRCGFPHSLSLLLPGPTDGWISLPAAPVAYSVLRHPIYETHAPHVNCNEEILAVRRFYWANSHSFAPMPATCRTRRWLCAGPNWVMWGYASSPLRRCPGSKLVARIGNIESQRQGAHGGDSVLRRAQRTHRDSSERSGP